MNLINQKLKSTVLFPSASFIISEHLKKEHTKNPDNFCSAFSTARLKKQLINAQEIIKGGDPMALIAFATKPAGDYEDPKSLTEIINGLEFQKLLPNEFYVLFDIQKFNHCLIDNRIKSALGIEPEDFNLRAMSGLDPENDLYHEDDYLHVIRWASMGYLLLTLPIFRWKSFGDVYRVGYRSGTKKSEIKELKASKHIYLEKNCTIIYDYNHQGKVVPSYHIDRWSVLPAELHKYVQPRFLSTPSREKTINGFLYLLNLYLLKFPVKYVAILQAKSKSKNNIIATQYINDMIEKHGHVKYSFTSKKITDTLHKSIRLRVEQTFNKWDKRQGARRVHCDCDNETVELAYKLGILPIPHFIEEIIYQNINLSFQNT